MKNQWKNFPIPIRRMKLPLLKAWKMQPIIPSGPSILTWSMGGQTIYRLREAMTKKLRSPRAQGLEMRLLRLLAVARD
jgi:hypothetical protein